jgi:predicted transcriptional regulator
MSDDSVPTWKFLTNHAQVLVCIANDPGVRLRDIGDQVGITERAAHRIVTELGAAGYIDRERTGRRNRYTVNSHLPVHDPIARDQSIGRLLEILATAGPLPSADIN